MADTERTPDSPIHSSSDEGSRKSVESSPTKERDFEVIGHGSEGSPPVMVSSQINTDEFDPLAVRRHDPHPEEQHSAVDDFFAADSIQAGVDTVHDQIDSMLNRYSPVPPAEPIQEAKDEPSELESSQPLLDFGSGEGDQRTFYGGVHVRDEEPEETFERSGPLTIPSDVLSKNLEDTLAEDIVNHSIAEAAEKSSVKEADFEEPEPEPEPEPPRFESVPRPPTPPKDISDEEYQPSSLDLGPPPVTHSHSGSDDHPKSILKNAQACTWFDCNPTVRELIYWRDPKKSAAALSLALIALLLIAKMSLISLVSYAGLLVLGGTVGYRLFALAQARIKKTPDTNPFEPLLRTRIHMSTEKIHSLADVVAQKLALLAKHLRHLILVEDLADSLKFGLILWTLTVVGRWFSGLALCFIAVLGLFSIPKFYEVYKAQIDEHLRVAREHANQVHDAMVEKLPFLKQKTN